MALVNIQNIQFHNNPCPFLSPFKLDVTFECIKPIPDDIEWQLIYIGSAKDEKYDQVLDKFSISSLDQGVLQFTIETNAPDHTKIPNKDDLLGVTAIILTVSYHNQEFFRVGYYVYNQYTDPELIANDPPQILIDKVERSILHTQPRITHFNIRWGTEDENKETDPNTLAILQQQLAQNGVIPNQLMQEMQQVNSQMQSFLPDPFSKSSGILQELTTQGQNNSTNSFMFGQGLDIPQNNVFQPTNIFSSNPY
ncbi:hypothetical protein ABPG72_013032 [Tetrahymena utriculariae]